MLTPKMSETRYRGRRAVSIENASLRLTVTVEGGHIAEITDKQTGINPLWSPPWPTIEPSSYDPQRHTEYGNDAESKLLAGILGHNLCLDVFGPPSAEEAGAGITVHGEASVNEYRIEASSDSLIMGTVLEAAQLSFERRIRLDGRVAHISESVENLGSLDRPVAWTQHVTLGPPFIQHGKTRFEVNAGRSRVFEPEMPSMALVRGADFDWPHAPGVDGGTIDLRTYTSAEVSAAFTTHLMNDPAYFVAETDGLRFGYRWRRDDFPWLGIWEENRSRRQPPWNGQTVTRGMEFGVSPMPETRRAMIDRGALFGVPGYRWIPARSRVEVRYHAAAGPSGANPLDLFAEAREDV